MTGPTAAAPLVRLDPAVDPCEPSPGAASALALAPVSVAATDTGLVDASAQDLAAVVEVVAAAESSGDGLAVVVPLPSPRSPEDAEVVTEVVTGVVAAVAARPEVVVRVGLDTGEVSVHVGQHEPTAVAPEQRAAEIAQLNRLWASGTGPDTGSMRITAAA